MKQYLPSKATAKAVVSALVVAAAYLTGVIPAEGSFGDVSTNQWLGLVVFIGGAYGITYAVPNQDRSGVRQDESVQPPERGAVDVVTVLVVVVLVVALLVLLGFVR